MPEALVKGGGGVVRADHDADRGPAEIEVPYRALVPPAGDLQGGAPRAVLARQSEAPASHGRTTDPPLIGPLEDAGPTDPSLDGRPKLPVEDLRLLALPIRLLTR